MDGDAKLGSNCVWHVDDDEQWCRNIIVLLLWRPFHGSFTLPPHWDCVNMTNEWRVSPFRVSRDFWRLQCSWCTWRRPAERCVFNICYRCCNLLLFAAFVSTDFVLLFSNCKYVCVCVCKDSFRFVWRVRGLLSVWDEHTLKRATTQCHVYMLTQNDRVP